MPAKPPVALELNAIVWIPTAWNGSLVEQIAKLRKPSDETSTPAMINSDLGQDSMTKLHVSL